MIYSVRHMQKLHFSAILSKNLHSNLLIFLGAMQEKNGNTPNGIEATDHDDDDARKTKRVFFCLNNFCPLKVT